MNDFKSSVHAYLKMHSNKRVVQMNDSLIHVEILNCILRYPLNPMWVVSEFILKMRIFSTLPHVECSGKKFKTNDKGIWE